MGMYALTAETARVRAGSWRGRDDLAYLVPLSAAASLPEKGGADGAGGGHFYTDVRVVWCLSEINVASFSRNTLILRWLHASLCCM